MAKRELNWRSLLANDIVPALRGDKQWAARLGQVGNSRAPARGLHLAVFVEPFLQLLLDGRKTIESRFSINRCAPYHQVYSGDLVLLKRSGGPIVGLAEVGDVEFHVLTPAVFRALQRDYAKELCAEDPAFWRARAEATVATLMRVANVRSLPDLAFEKRDRRGWVVLHGSRQLEVAAL